MAKRVTVWALPSLAFLVAAMAMLLSGPSWALLSRRTFFTSLADCTSGCKECCDLSDEYSEDPDCDRQGPNPVCTHTGEHLFASIDLSDGGFDTMKASRHFITNPAYSDTIFGSCWRWGVPQLIDQGAHVNLVFGSRHARSWTKVLSGSTVIGYTPDLAYHDTLAIYDANTLVLNDEAGNCMIFYNFTYPTPAFQGKLYQMFSSYVFTPNPAGFSGSYTSALYTSGGVFAGLSQQEETSGVVDSANENQLIANLGGPFANLVCTAIFQFHFVANVSNTVRSTSNEYYDGTDPANGPAGMLKRVTIMDPASNVIERKYYRYGNSGVKVTLRTAVEGSAYERLKHAVGDSDANVLTASDATVNTYANTYVYDGTGRETSETLQGKGTSTFTLVVSDSGFANDVNSWKRETVETLPDGSTSTVFTTNTGQALFKDFQSGGQHWLTSYQYDASARLIAEATPSAVTSYTTVNPPANLGVVFNSTGLFRMTTYGASTTATTTAAGDVVNYVKSRQVKQGSAGTPVTTEAYTYIAHTSTQLVSVTTYVPASKTVYENSDGTGVRTTSYTYTWLVPPGTSTQSNHVESTTTTFPAVATANNGSGSATANIQFCDKWLHATWFKDEDGFIQVRRWDRLTGACTQAIADVNTATTTDEPTGWVTPAGGGLHLITNYVDDLLGRWTKITDPANEVTYNVYNDASWETRTYPGWTGTATTGPTRLTRQDKPGSYKEKLTMSATPHVTGGAPDGTEAISGVVSDARKSFDTGNRIVNEDSYFNPPAWTASTSYGTLGTNFYRKINAYDSKGRVIHTVDWTGTIRDITYDGRDRITATKIGTNDTTSPNMIQDYGYEYDNNGIGNGNQTKSRKFTSAGVSLDTLYTYDFRNRSTQTQTPDGVTTVRTLDNLDRTTQLQTYAGAVSSANLRTQAQTAFDEKGAIYKKVAFGVDPTTGAVGNSLTTNVWSNARGLFMKSKGPNAQFLKAQYDGAGRKVARFSCFDDAETSYADAGTVVNDTVIEQDVFAYDADGNVIQATNYRRTQGTAKTGDLSVSWSANDSRRMFTASWFDVANRMTALANYGTNGGTTLSRPSTPPASGSATVLVTTYGYDAGGRRYQKRDNLSRLTQSTFDGLSRVTQVVENYVTGTPTETSLDTDRTTVLTFDSSGRLSTRVAKDPKGTGNGVQSQTTTYVYRTDSNVATPSVFRNDLLVAEIYPDSDDTYNDAGAAGARLGNGTDGVFDRVEYTYDYAGRRSTIKDQRGVVRTENYDSSGRLLSEAVTTLPSGVDGTVQRKEYGYDGISRILTATSYSAPSAGTVVNQVKYTYDGYWDVTKREDAHVGAVVSGTTPSVQVAYADGGSGGVAKYARPSSTTYPNGRIIYSNYPSSGIGDKLSRLDNYSNVANDPHTSTTAYAVYEYLGNSSIMDINHPEITTLGSAGLVMRQGPDTNPGAWDQFDRVLFTKWRNTGNTSSLDLYNYTYDVVGNRLTRQVAASTLPPAGQEKDEAYTDDGLNRLTKLNRGLLSGGTITDANRHYGQNWNALESQGNWRSYQAAPSGGATYTFTQARLHNSANEIDTDNNDANAAGASITGTGGGDWIDPTYDKAGNLKSFPQVGTETARQWATYDAWNRLVKVQADSSGSPGAEIAEYQYDAGNWRTVKLIPNGSNWNRTDYYHNLGWQCLEERLNLNVAGKTTVSTTLYAQYLWDARYLDAVIKRWRDSNGDGTLDEEKYYCQDANMNTTALVDKAAGTVTERYVYDAYGNATVFTGSWGTPSSTVKNEILFAGYRQDLETKLHLARNRSYHSTLGRWLERDPLRYRDSNNLYDYCTDNPGSFVDPTGLGKSELKFTMPDEITNNFEESVPGEPPWWVDFQDQWLTVRFTAWTFLKFDYKCSNKVKYKAQMNFLLNWAITVTRPDKTFYSYTATGSMTLSNADSDGWQSVDEKNEWQTYGDWSITGIFPPFDKDANRKDRGALYDGVRDSVQSSESASQNEVGTISRPAVAFAHSINIEINAEVWSEGSNGTKDYKHGYKTYSQPIK